jgi:carbamoyl-phosphate synthase small subunit
MNGKITSSLPKDTDRAEVKAYAVKIPVAAVSSRTLTKTGTGRHDMPLRRVALMDFGAKRSIAQALADRGCEVWSFPCNTQADAILAIKPDGIMLSNGPGDPADPANNGIIETIRVLAESGVPVFGICLGHQLLALANGYSTVKLKFGHRGANQPVKETATGRGYITSQNHGYAVVAKPAAGGHSGAAPAMHGSPPANSSFVNVNDGTCEGMDYGVSFSVQFHPEAHGGPEDTAFLFNRFLERMDAHAAR